MVWAIIFVQNVSNSIFCVKKQTRQYSWLSHLHNIHKPVRCPHKGSFYLQCLSSVLFVLSKVQDKWGVWSQSPDRGIKWSGIAITRLEKSGHCVPFRTASPHAIPTLPVEQSLHVDYKAQKVPWVVLYDHTITQGVNSLACNLSRW